MTRLGAFVGNSVPDLLKFEQWLGREVDHIEAHTGRASWADYDNSIPWAIGLWGQVDRPVFWTIPLFAQGGTLAAAGSGAYDGHYLKAARKLAATRPQDDVITVRVGEEFNGDWMPWAAKGKEADFVKAFQHFVDAFRSVSDRFRFEWNVNIGDFGMDPARAYPGDAYVDVIGMDFYYNKAWDPKDPAVAWDHMVQRKYGLQWHQDFAAAHGKPTAYSEWGVMSDDAEPYIRAAARWFDRHDVLYQNYWNSNADFTGKLTDGHKVKAAAAYREAFMDASEAVDLASALAVCYRLYEAAFDRAPDATGLATNVRLLENGLDLDQMAHAFVTSAEFASLNGADASDRAFVTALYRNVLEREPDPAGLAAWLEALRAGGQDRAGILVGFSESPENRALTADAIRSGSLLDLGALG